MRSDQRVEELLIKVFSGNGKIAVYGVGYVGLSLVAVYLRKGLNVIGVDIDEGKLNAIRSGDLWFNELEIKEAVSQGLSSNKLVLTTDGVSASRDSVIKVITVPIRIDWETKKIGYEALLDVASKISKGLKKGDLVILESSVPPGTTEEVLKPVLESGSGLTAEEDFFLAYSPERVYIGRAVKDIERNYPKVIGGVGPSSLEAAAKFYERIVEKGVIRLSSTRAAEFEKLAEGVYRDVNIALANELAVAAMELGVDFYEAREAANSQPYSHIHLPGPGVGGYCIPTYPYFMMVKLTQKGFIMPLTRLARIINESMPQKVVSLAEELRYLAGISVRDVKAAVLGAAFRGDIDDTRLSPTHDIVALMKARGYRDILVHDPLVKNDEILKLLDVRLTNDLSEALRGRNVIVIATRHSAYKGLKVSEILSMAGTEPVIIDTVNVIDDDVTYRKLLVLGKPAKISHKKE